MGAPRAVIHCNPVMPHQSRYAAALAEGFRRHGMDCLITAAKDSAGDAHLCIGPHYALDGWRGHPRCVHIDRAFWADPECVSGGWAQPDGSRRFPIGDEPREKPALLAPRHGRHAIVLADYGDSGEDLAALLRPHSESVMVRRHPADGGEGSLLAALSGKSIAIGRMTTALIDAAIHGLAVICRDPRNPVMPVASSSPRELRHADRTAWLHGLSWGNWHHDEIANGDLWEALTTRCG